MDKFSRQRWPQSKFHDIHVFGCPTYVLSKRIADGKTQPKFQPRSERHVYLGFSKFHASTVPLVLNPRTGSITPQYHCVFDDWFATIATDIKDVPTFMEQNWQTLFGDSEYQFPADDTNPPALTPTPLRYQPSPLDNYNPNNSIYLPPPTPLSSLHPSSDAPPAATAPPPAAAPPFVSSSQPSLERERVTVETTQATTRLPMPSLPQREPPSTVQREQQEQSQLQREQQDRLKALQQKETSVRNHQRRMPTELPMDIPYEQKRSSPSKPSLRRSSRTTKGVAAPILDPNPSSKTYGSKAHHSSFLAEMDGWFLSEMDESINPDFNNDDNIDAFPKDTPFIQDDDLVLTPSHSSYKRFTKQPESDDGKICGYYDLHFSYLGYTKENKPNFMFIDSKASAQSLEFLKAASTDPDILTWDEAMSGTPEEVTKWREAALKEVRALEHKETWLESAESVATVRVIPGTWVLRRKRAPDGTIIKYKARWVLRGDLQDLDMDTRADVVAWSSVRIFMVLSLKLGWAMKSIDFTNAFLHAKLPEHIPMFVHLPRGFYSNMRSITGERTILNMKKSCYGSKVAPCL